MSGPGRSSGLSEYFCVELKTKKSLKHAILVFCKPSACGNSEALVAVLLRNQRAVTSRQSSSAGWWSGGACCRPLL